MPNPRSRSDAGRRCLSSWAPVLLAVLSGCGGAPPEKAAGPAASPAQPAPVKITHFYASPGVVTEGEEVILCYGVENADAVALEPALEELRPSRNRCISFVPPKTGVYRLTARGPSGAETSELELKVLPAPPPDAAQDQHEQSLIPLFLANRNEIAAGEPVTICYSFEGAESVTLDPPVVDVEPVSRCFATRLDETTTFTLAATGSGRREERQLTVTVK